MSKRKALRPGTKPPLTLEEVAGSIEPVNTPEDWEARIREAKQEKAERTIREMKQSG
jgi:hypothetical protein